MFVARHKTQMDLRKCRMWFMDLDTWVAGTLMEAKPPAAFEQVGVVSGLTVNMGVEVSKVVAALVTTFESPCHLRCPGGGWHEPGCGGALGARRREPAKLPTVRGLDAEEAARWEDHRALQLM